MFILRKVFKIMLLPIVLVLILTKCLLSVSMRVTESVIGLLTMIVGAGIVYYLICKNWSNAFLMSIIFAAIIIFMMATIIVQDWCDMLIGKIGTL